MAKPSEIQPDPQHRRVRISTVPEALDEELGIHEYSQQELAPGEGSSWDNLQHDAERLYEFTRKLFYENRELHNQLDELQRELESNEVEATLRKKLAETIDERNEYALRIARANEPGARASSVVSTGGSKSEKIADPDQFEDGHTGPKFEPWILMIKRKLSGNADRFPTEESKISYVLGRVKGLAHDIMYPRVKEDADDPYKTVQDVYNHLSSTFADPNRKQQAKREYKVLRMKPGQSFKDYVAKFEALAQAAGVRREEMKPDLYESLSASFKKLVIMYYHQSPDYSTFVQNCHLMADSLQGIETSYQLEKADRAPKGTVTRTRTTPTATAVTATGTSVPRLPAPTGGYLPITPEEHLRCRIEGLCFYCREKGHMTPDCPKKTARAQSAALKALERPENEEAGVEQDLEAKKDSA